MYLLILDYPSIFLSIYLSIYGLLSINRSIDLSKSFHFPSIYLSLSLSLSLTHTHTHTHTHTLYIYIYIYIYISPPYRLRLFGKTDIKLHLMVKLQSWSFGECWVPLLYSQVHFDPDGQYLFRFHQWVKQNCSVIYKQLL